MVPVLYLLFLSFFGCYAAQTEPVTQQPRIAVCAANTVNTYRGVSVCVCAPLVVKNGGVGCPLRCCCACTCSGWWPNIGVAGCLVTHNTKLRSLPPLPAGSCDRASDLDGQRRDTVNLSSKSVENDHCLCVYGRCPTVNNSVDNKEQ